MLARVPASPLHAMTKLVSLMRYMLLTAVCTRAMRVTLNAATGLLKVASTWYELSGKLGLLSNCSCAWSKQRNECRHS